ncbi:MAG: flagellar basal body rod protein FlgG [Clostridiales bacterium]|uniref:flagellar hook-basal body complex protein n=1 Tax=Clostridium sp. N3C TaxID=1776758 RepID=UPI00092DEAC6|nr:flagellar hook-basal body complex protein [Clostridium sp. N3C]NLZ48088.1 flagellar basal body rod protein FlgG [Clostridiales bacterium]SCN21326.1 Distal rod protein [Clostridium sp. N3C]
MIRGLYTAVSGLITQEAKQQVITNNMANANTTGYKTENLAVKKFDDVLIQNYDKISGGKNVRNVIGSLSNGSKIDETLTDFTQGTLQSTEKDTDFALDGRGFFTVSGAAADGTQGIYYTRDGAFHINNLGYLVNSTGNYVMGRNINTGAMEPIAVGNSKITTDGNNNILLDGQLRYSFNIVDFENYNALEKVGDNLYRGENPMESQATVKQYSLEKSNVNIINEMVNMMTVLRTYESNQKVVQSLDETLAKAVEIGIVR